MTTNEAVPPRHPFLDCERADVMNPSGATG
jgi:hypothetical protein